jgi:hypothetical protein
MRRGDEDDGIKPQGELESPVMPVYPARQGPQVRAVARQSRRLIDAQDPPIFVKQSTMLMALETPVSTWEMAVGSWKVMALAKAASAAALRALRLPRELTLILSFRTAIVVAPCTSDAFTRQVTTLLSKRPCPRVTVLYESGLLGLTTI